MAKEKVKIEEQQKNYFYEIIGMTMVVICLIILGGLGKFGSSLNLILKFLFGDFSFAFIIAIMWLGFKSIVKKRLVDTHSVVFQGIIIGSFGLLSLCHLSLYEEIPLSDSTVISGTLKLFKQYYVSYESNYITGGGIIGAVVFQVLIFFFGKTGTIVLSILLIVVGISFVSNASVLSFANKIKQIKNFFVKFFRRIQNYFSKVDYSNKKETKFTPTNINLNSLSDIKPSVNTNIQYQISKEQEENLKLFIKQFSLPIIYERFKVGYNSTTFKFTLIGENNTKVLQSKIFEFFNQQCFFITRGKIMYAEVNNKFKELLTLKRLLTNSYNETYLLPLALNNDLDDLCIDLTTPNYYIISGDISSGVKTYVRSLIVSIILKYSLNFNIAMIDTKSEFRELDLISESIEYTIGSQKALEVLDDLCIEAERRRELFSFLNVDDFKSANDEIENSHHKLENLKPYFLFINTSISKHNSEFENKLNYLTKFSSKLGIYIFVCVRKREDLGSITLNNASKICFYTSSLDLSLKLLNSDICCALQKKGDVLYQIDNQIHHGQSPYLSISDYEKILRKIL